MQRPTEPFEDGTAKVIDSQRCPIEVERIAIDNVLWSGRVLDGRDRSADTRALRALNATLKDDARIDLAMVGIGDGLTLARVR